MNPSRLQSVLENAKLCDYPIKIGYSPDTSGVWGHWFVVNDEAMAGAEAGYHAGAIAVDITNNTQKYNSGSITSATWSNIGAAASLDLQGAYANGAEVTGADSAAHAVLVGDGSNAIGLYELAGDCYVTTTAAGGADLNLVPDGDLVITPTGGDITVTGDVAITGNLSASGTFSPGATTLTGTLSVGASGAGQDAYLYSTAAGDYAFWDASEKCLVMEDSKIHFQDNDELHFGAGSATGTGDFKVYSNGTSLYFAAIADVANQTIYLGDDTNDVDVIWEGDTNAAIFHLDSSANEMFLNGCTQRMGDGDKILLGDGASSNGDFHLYSDGTHAYLQAVGNNAGATLYLGDATNHLDVVWAGTTASDVVTFDHDNDKVTFTDISLDINESGDPADNTGCLSVDATSLATDGGCAIYASYASGTPHTGARMFEIAAAGKDLRGIFADCDGETNDVFIFNGGGAIATGKAILKVTGDGEPAAADSYLAYFDYSGMTSTNNPVAMKLKSKGTAAQLEIETTDTGATGVRIMGKHTSTGSAVANDAVFVIDAYGLDAGNASTLYGKIEAEIMTATAGQEDGRWVFSAAANDSTLIQLAAMNPRADGSLAELVLGAGATNAYLTTNGAGDLILDTNQGTDSGSITIADGANGDITIAPNGTGDVLLAADTVKIGDSGADATFTSTGNGDLIIQTGNATTGNLRLYDAANGNLVFTPNGTGFFYVVGDALASASVRNYTPVTLRYSWTHETPDGNNDLIIALPLKCTILDVRMQVTTPEGGAMTATLRTAAAGAGSTISSALNCNDVTLVRTTALTSNEDIAAGNIYCNFSGNPGTAVGTLYIDYIPTE